LRLVRLDKKQQEDEKEFSLSLSLSLSPPIFGSKVNLILVSILYQIFFVQELEFVFLDAA
jgi:hypothetical protein